MQLQECLDQLQLRKTSFSAGNCHRKYQIEQTSYQDEFGQVIDRFQRLRAAAEGAVVRGIND